MLCITFSSLQAAKQFFSQSRARTFVARGFIVYLHVVSTFVGVVKTQRAKMKFNQKELVAYASVRSGKADKEGFLYMRESDKRKDAYSQRWFTLSGNLLFYTKDESKDSPVVGVIVLEQCKVESEAHSGNRNAFRLLFHDSDSGGYWFFADSAREADEWIRILNCTSYENLRTQFSELRGQLIQLTGKDPVSDGGPLGDWSVNTMPTLATPAPGYDGEPVFELRIACSSLMGLNGGLPSALVITNCKTPPQAYWIRYAQTEVVENTCDPQFTTPVLFFEGKIFTSSKLQFCMFDVFNKAENLMNPLGQVECMVQDIIADPSKILKLDIMYAGRIRGYLLLTTRMCGRRRSTVKPTETVTIDERKMKTEMSFTTQSFRSPMDNIVVRRYQFPLCDTSDHHLNATEIMGECSFCYSIPIQLLELFIAEENSLTAQLKTLNGLAENWEINLEEIILEIKSLVKHYEKNREELQIVSESGKLFKKSVDKDNPKLEFIPVNLHIQELKQAPSSEKKERIIYSCITVGCPSAYSLKYKQGGLARLQAATPHLAISGPSFSMSSENKSFKVKQLLKRLSIDQASIKRKTEDLLSAAQYNDIDQMKSIITALVDMVASFENRCKIMLLKDGLKDWYNALNPAEIPAFIRSLTELSPTSVLSSVEEHLVCLEAQVDGIVTRDVLQASVNQLSGPAAEFLKAFDNAIDIFQKSLFFVLLKEQHTLQINKISLGLKGFKHRRDIVFSQAVTSVVTSFVMKLLRSISSKHFLTQLQEIGFLVHWESLLSTHSDETGMLEDFIMAIHDINTMKFRLIQATSVNDTPRVQGSRYRIIVDIPVQTPMYRILPAGLQNGKEITVTAVLFTQGINEQQSIADTFGDNHLQDQINYKNYQKLSQYCEKFREKFGTSGIPMSRKASLASDYLFQLNGQIHHTRKAKNTDILTLSQAVCRTLECGRLTSCKSGKDRTGMSVTLEQSHLLLSEGGMNPSSFQQCLDQMRSQGTRLRNCEKNIGSPLYAFNALQVVTLPKNYRPPEGTYKKLQT